MSPISWWKMPNSDGDFGTACSCIPDLIRTGTCMEEISINNITELQKSRAFYPYTCLAVSEFQYSMHIP